MSDALTGGAGLGLAPIREAIQSPGQVADTWQDAAGDRVVGIGPPGLRVQVTTNADNTLTVSASPPPISKTAAATAMRPSGSGESTAVSLLRADASAPASIPARADAYIYTSWCAGYYPSGGGWITACDLEYMVQNNGGGDWYLADQVTTSANASGLHYYSTDLSWPTNNRFVQWNPSSPTSVGGCQTVNEAVSYDGFNVGTQYQVCSETVTPTVYNNGAPWFLMTSSNACGWIAFWDTCPSGSQGYDTSDIVHSPPSAAYDPLLSVQMQWNGGNNAGGGGAYG
jgi:hypothetical protein